MNPRHAVRTRMRSFGVRQLAAALTRACLLATIGGCSRNPEEHARAEKSGSKLPHSKASLLRLARKPRATQMQTPLQGAKGKSVSGSPGRRARHGVHLFSCPPLR